MPKIQYLPSEQPETEEEEGISVCYEKNRRQLTKKQMQEFKEFLKGELGDDYAMPYFRGTRKERVQWQKEHGVRSENTRDKLARKRFSTGGR